MQPERPSLRVRTEDTLEAPPPSESPEREASGDGLNPQPVPSTNEEELFWQTLSEAVGEKNFQHWFAGKTTLSQDGERITLGVGSPFLLKWMQTRFRDAVTAAARSLVGPSAQIEFAVDAKVSLQPATAEKSDSPAQPDSSSETETAAEVVSTTPGETVRPAKPVKSGRRFRDLAELVPGKCNELALTAARQVGDAPGAKLNPLYVHGGVGTGKTHVLEGIYRRLRNQYPSLHVMFLTSEAFANYFTQALRERTLPSFRQKFRYVDVLLVDDIEFLNGKRATQEEFLHTVKELLTQGRQVIASADCHPRLLTKVSEELTSRFLSGLVCRLEAPDLETRLSIVKQKAAAAQVNVSPGVINYVANRFKNNVRELEGAMNCLCTWQEMTGKSISKNAARSVLGDLERDCLRIVRVSDVESTVCEFFGLSSEDIQSSKRHRRISQPRMLAMYLARRLTAAAYSEIGQHFGGRNHSTVVSAERKVKSWLQEETTLEIAAQAWQVEDLIEALEQLVLAG